MISSALRTVLRQQYRRELLRDSLGLGSGADMSNLILGEPPWLSKLPP